MVIIIITIHTFIVQYPRREVWISWNILGYGLESVLWILHFKIPLSYVVYLIVSVTLFVPSSQLHCLSHCFSCIASLSQLHCLSHCFSYIKDQYGEHLSSGFILIMEVDQSAYPPLDNLKRNYNDPPFRVKWRSKQVVDYAFMFYVGKNLSKYYMQIEDDVISSMKLLTKIKDGIAKAQQQWTTLEFAYLGFIGKLYKAEDLERFAEFLCCFMLSNQ